MSQCAHDVIEKLDYDTVQDFNYVKCCYQESLRKEAPAPITIPSNFIQDTVVGQHSDRVPTIKMQKDTIYVIVCEEIHKDPTEWREPHSFNPARFDTTIPDNEWLLRPDGKPRNTYSYSPFSGGKRICLGKTFAEQVFRFTLPMLFHYLDFDFGEASQKDFKHQFSADG